MATRTPATRRPAPSFLRSVTVNAVVFTVVGVLVLVGTAAFGHLSWPAVWDTVFTVALLVAGAAYGHYRDHD